MRKNKIMRFASLILVLTLLSTSVISGTFAKYTTSAESEDKARVAKWGFENSEAIDIDDLFKNAYDSTVKSSVDVIAPGTENQVEFSFSYDTTSNNVAAPEVDYTFEVEVETSGTTTKLDKNPNFKWTLDGAEYDTFSKLTDAVKALDGNISKYEAGTLPTAFYTDSNGEKTHTIGWKWAFETKDTNGNVDSTQDVTDTAMGNADTLENVSIKISITATQID